MIGIDLSKVLPSVGEFKLIVMDFNEINVFLHFMPIENFA